jgi:hypothetical protein
MKTLLTIALIALALIGVAGIAALAFLLPWYYVPALMLAGFWFGVAVVDMVMAVNRTRWSNP